MLKLKLQFFGHIMRSADSFEKTLMLGKIEGRRRGLERMRWWMEWPTQCTWDCASCGSWLWTGKPGMLQFMGSQRVRHAWATELNWTENNTHLLSHTSTGHLSKHCLPEFSDKDLTLKLKYQSDWVSVWITQRRICFQVYSDFWENPVLCFYNIEILTPWWLLAKGHFQPLEYACIPCYLVLSFMKSSYKNLHNIKSFHILKESLSPGRMSFLLRTHLIRSGLPRTIS